MWIWIFLAFMSGGVVGILAMALASVASDPAPVGLKNDNTCMFCGESIPEGRQVCPTCERRLTEC